MRYLTILAVFMLPFIISAPAKADGSLSTAEKSQIEKMIADYFIENPEALGAALENMQSHYQQKEEQRKKQRMNNNAYR